MKNLYTDEEYKEMVEKTADKTGDYILPEVALAIAKEIEQAILKKLKE